MDNRTVYEKVFDIPHLHEKILKHAFQNSNGQLEIVDVVKSCRLVCKTWMLSTSKVLRKIKTPLFKLSLDEINPQEGVVQSKPSDQLLDEFSNLLIGPDWMKKVPPPFGLTVGEGFFREELYPKFENLLNIRGQDLVELNVIFPKDGGSMTFYFDHLQLPILSVFNIKFSNVSLKDLNRELPTVTTFGNNNNAVYFMKQIMSAAINLKSLSFNQSDYGRYCEYLVPFGLQHLKMSPTILSMTILCDAKPNDLLVLTRNPLSHLKSLTINIPCHSIGEDDLIFKILEPIKDTLQDLTFCEHDNICFRCPQQQFMRFRFPKMDKLKALSISSPRIYLAINNFTELEKSLPLLESIFLKDITYLQCHGWTDQSRFESVRKLELCFIDGHYEPGMLTGFTSAFPNVQNLNLTLPATHDLLTVFDNVKDLQELKLTFTGLDDVLHNEFWNTVFGISGTVFGISRNNQPSILKLTELKSLTLKGQGRLQQCYIPEIVFSKGLLKMQKLQTLILFRPFSALSFMTHLWNKKGRSIQYPN